MKKVLLGLLTSMMFLSTGMLSVNAEETITKDYLMNTLQMNDEQIISSGLSYVYDVGDVITLKLKTTDQINAGNNVVIPADTDWDIEFEVVAKGVDEDNYLTLITKDALPIGKVSMDDGSNTAGLKFEDNWINTLLNTHIQSMFAPGVQNKLADFGRATYMFIKSGDAIKDLSTGAGAISTYYPKNKLWIPSAKELGYGNSTTINQGSLTDYTLNTLGKVIAPFNTTPKANTVNCGQENATYWLREGFYTGSNGYFLATGANGVEVDNRVSGKHGVVFGMDVCWSLDIQEQAEVNPEENTDEGEVLLSAYAPSTYAVDLPESVTITQDFTQFNYNVSGDIEKNKAVKVQFPETSKLTFTGGFYKDDIDLNVFNEKVIFTRSDCYGDGTSAVVTIKNQAPSAGTWSGSLPVTISFGNAN